MIFRHVNDTPGLRGVYGHDGLQFTSFIIKIMYVKK